MQEVSHVDSAPGRPRLRCGKRSFRGPQSTAGRTHRGGTTGLLSPAKKGLLSSQLKGCCSQRPQHCSIGLLCTEKATPKHQTPTNSGNVLPAADPVGSASQNSRAAEQNKSHGARAVVSFGTSWHSP